MLKGYYLPPGFNSENITSSPVSYGSLTIEQILPSTETISNIAEYLRAQTPLIRKISFEEISDILDEAASIWLSGSSDEYEEVLDSMRAVTGFSKENVAESLRLEQESSRKHDIISALKNEFGNPEVLDRFTYRAETASKVRALGPGLTFAVLPGNIPGLSHLSFMRSLLVKSPFFCKTASSEPVYAAAYARTLASLDRRIGEALAVLNWPGQAQELNEAAVRKADAVIVYGSTESCSDIHRYKKPGSRMILHGHKLGFSFLGKKAEVSSDLAGRIAYDISVFDQQACLSPHWIFVEGDKKRARSIAHMITTALREEEKRMPRGLLSLEESSSFSRVWDDAELAQIIGEEVEILSERGKDAFLVMLDSRKPLRPGPLSRSITILPVLSSEDMAELLKPFLGLFQNAAVEGAEENTAELLAQLGVSRICSPGKMPSPTMMWHHDGRPCLEDMVRYTDWESQEHSKG